MIVLQAPFQCKRFESSICCSLSVLCPGIVDYCIDNDDGRWLLYERLFADQCYVATTTNADRRFECGISQVRAPSSVEMNFVDQYILFLDKVVKSI